jgi:hypothetical protein
MGLKNCMVCGKLCRGHEANFIKLSFKLGQFYKGTNHIFRNPFIVVCNDPICKNTFSIWFIMDYCMVGEESKLEYTGINGEVVEC